MKQKYYNYALGLVIVIALGCLYITMKRKSSVVERDYIQENEAMAVYKTLHAKNSTQFSKHAEPPKNCCEKLDLCQEAMLTAWLYSNHPVDIASYQSASDVAEAFVDVYYGDDDPEFIESSLCNSGHNTIIDEIAAEENLEIEDISVNCDPLPCKVSMTVGFENPGVSADWAEMENHFERAIELSVEGYNIVNSGNNEVWDSTSSNLTVEWTITKRSDDELEELQISMWTFAERILGLRASFSDGNSEQDQGETPEQGPIK